MPSQPHEALSPTRGQRHAILTGTAPIGDVDGRAVANEAGITFRRGAISKVTMREFDAICPPPVREFSGDDKGLQAIL